MTQSLGDVLAGRIRRYRKARGLSIRQLSERCSELGAPQLTVASLSNIERGQKVGALRQRREVLVTELAVLADALTVSVDDLLYDTCAQCGARILGAIEDPLKMCDTCRADYADWQAARKVEQR